MTIGPLPRMTPKTIGTMIVHALVDSVGPVRLPGDLLLNLPKECLQRNSDWLQPDYIQPNTGLMIMAYTSFLIRIDGVSILIDCAVGEDANFPSRPDWHFGKSNWLNHLGQAGIGVEDIDIVLLTHLHADHTGWLTRKTLSGWIPSFPEARHLTSKKELQFWPEKATDFPFMSTSVGDNVVPLLEAGHFETVEAGSELAPGLFVVDLAGHSPGMIGLEYRKSGRIVAAFCADLMHHPMQMAAPQCATVFCHDPASAVSVRKRKLAEYAANGTLVFCNHFPGECAGQAIKQCDGYRFLPVV
ncbi:MAG: MBL fold metallo-hydrolase [Rhizobiaceae bacterium MnEN-MB40S]|nr:MAG: MBL fold metallo-hydrolase [Rhizobiaceae bacterium MnEN-MB40S]